jgi:hypothetical protein
VGFFAGAGSSTTLTGSQVTRNHANGGSGSQGGGVYSLGTLAVDSIDSIFANAASGGCNDIFDLLSGVCV